MATKKSESAATLTNLSLETGGLVYVTGMAQSEYCGDREAPQTPAPAPSLATHESIRTEEINAILRVNGIYR